MIALEDIRLAEQTARELRAGGQEERARALEALLAVAGLVLAGELPASGREYLTTGQAARALGVSRQTIKNWVAAGQLQAVRLGGRTLVHRDALETLLARLRDARPQTVERTPADVTASQRQYEAMLASLPADQLVRLEALHEKMEQGQRLSRDERAEMVTLERVLAHAAGQYLVERTDQSHTGGG